MGVKTGLFCLLMVSCSEVAPERPDVHFKPSPPIELAIATDGGRWVTATATPSVDVTTLEIAVAGRTARFARVDAGDSRSLRVLVARDSLVRASARADLRNGMRPNRVAEIAVGNPPVARRTAVRVIDLPGGERIDEVRP